MDKRDEDINDLEEEEKTPSKEWRINLFTLKGGRDVKLNVDLLPMKLIYFFFFGGYAFILPFLPVFYRYLGMSARQTGIILGLRTIAQFIGAPIWGALADKTRRHKLVMLIGMVLSMSLLFSAVFIAPPSKTDEVEMECCFTCVPKTHLNFSSLYVSIDLIVFNYSASPVTILKPDHEALNSIVNKQINVCSENEGIKDLPIKITVKSKHFVTLRHMDKNYSDCGLKTPANFSLNITSCELRRNVVEVTIQPQQCNATRFIFCTNGYKVTTPNSSNRFALLFSLTLLGSFFMTFESGFADATVTKYMEKTERPGGYGKQRIWGGIGWAICSVLAGIANDTSRGSKFLISFCSYLGLTILSMLCVFKLHMSHLAGEKKPPIFKNLAKIFANFGIVAFLFAELVMGLCNAFIQIYLFLFLDDLGATNLVMGLSLFVTTCAENPLMFASGYVIKKLGHNGVFYLVFLAYTLRFLCYSFLENAWYVLPIEVFHGITYGLMWPATTSYVGIASPPGMAATLQGIVTAIHWALGAFLAGVAGGPLYAKFGARKIFRGLSLLALISGLVYAVSRCCHRTLLRKQLEDQTHELRQLNEQSPKT